MEHHSLTDDAPGSIHDVAIHDVAIHDVAIHDVAIHDVAIHDVAIHDVAIHAVASGGAGVGRLPDGKVVFVHRTAPGDRARVRVRSAPKRWARGELVAVLRPGPDRSAPACALYGSCGGCTLQHLDYARQLEAKSAIVADAFERIGKVPIDPPEVVPSPDRLEYRNRVTFTLRRLSEGRIVAGFHGLDRPDRLVRVRDECVLPERRIMVAWKGLRCGWGPSAERLPGGSELRLTLRSVQGGVVLVVHGGAGDGRPQELMTDVAGLRAVWKAGSDGLPRLLAGESDLAEAWIGRSVSFRATAFSQVNSTGAALVHESVMEAAGDAAGLKVVDAYCGLGFYGADLARAGARVQGIEHNAEAVEVARAEAPGGFQVTLGTVEERLADVLPADLLILNPPRAGLHAALPPLLSERGPRRIVYVSCDPATLARDVARLDGAYVTERMRCFDLFPQTAHVETVALLTRLVKDPCAIS